MIRPAVVIVPAEKAKPSLMDSTSLKPLSQNSKIRRVKKICQTRWWWFDGDITELSTSKCTLSKLMYWGCTVSELLPLVVGLGYFTESHSSLAHATYVVIHA
jgi:hypothetical protein